MGSRWVEKGIMDVLLSDVTVYKAETPSYNTDSEGSYMDMEPDYYPIPSYPNPRGASIIIPSVQALVVEIACLQQTAF